MPSTAVSDAVSEILDSGFNFWQTCKTVNSFDMCLRAKLLQSCLTFCDPVNCSLPGSSVHGILQARLLEWIAIPFCRESAWTRVQTQVSCISGRFFTSEPPGSWETSYLGFYLVFRTMGKRATYITTVGKLKIWWKTFQWPWQVQIYLYMYNCISFKLFL